MEETNLEKGFLNRDDFGGRVAVFFFGQEPSLGFLKTKMYYMSRVTKTMIHVF